MSALQCTICNRDWDTWQSCTHPGCHGGATEVGTSRPWTQPINVSPAQTIGERQLATLERFAASAEQIAEAAQRFATLADRLEPLIARLEREIALEDAEVQGRG